MSEDVIQQLVKMVARSNELSQEMIERMDSLEQRMDEFRAEVSRRFERVEEKLNSIECQLLWHDKRLTDHNHRIADVEQELRVSKQ